MTWEAVSAVAEIVGAIAVVVTLAYLARQIHQSNQLLNEQAGYNMLQNQLSYYDGMAREPDLVNVVYGIPKDNQALTIQKKAESHATAEFLRWHWEYVKIRRLSVVSDWSDLPILAFRREWQRAQFGKFWPEQKAIFPPEFVAFIDEEIDGKPYSE